MTSAHNPHDAGAAGAIGAVYLTAPEAAAKLRVGPWQVVALCRSGELRATKPGRKWLIAPADLDAYIAGGRNDQAASA